MLFIKLSVSHQLQTIAITMSSGLTATQSVVVQRLCAIFGKEYNEVSSAIQAEMTAMEHELQCWKLQIAERGEESLTTSVETKKAKKPRANAKKPAADVAAAAQVTEDSVDGATEEVASVVVKPAAAAKKAPAKPRANAKKAVVVADATASLDTAEQSADSTVVEGETQLVVDESSSKIAKKSAAKPRAKKAVAQSAESDESASTVTAKKASTAKPRAKKAAVEPVVVVAAAASEIELVAEETTTAAADEFVEVEVEVEVSEFEFNGVQYLRAKDNKLYDPETSEIVGMWNESQKTIDECEEESSETEVEQAD